MADEKEGGTDQGDEEGQERERSTIQFPYVDLREALTVVKAIFENGGGRGAIDQVAAWMRQSASSGAFRTKINSARIFGFVETQRGEVVLTALGTEAADSDTQRRACIKAFLRVPLYSRLYEQHRGSKLPGNVGLDAAIGTLGVAPKQVSKARQTFQRSAELAGFFDHGKDRLVQPTDVASERTDTPPKLNEIAPPPKPEGRREFHPFIQGLLDTLPPPGEVWDAAGRKQWITAAESIFTLIYKAPPEQQ